MAAVRLLAIACAFVAAANCQSCRDLDTHACELMEVQDPNLCIGSPIAESACPKYCGFCGVECYHCDATLTNYTQCTTTKICVRGEKCLLRRLRSSLDNHVEYNMACASLEECDGVSPQIVGRRDIESRDLSLTCCSTARCNRPDATPPTTTPPTTTPPTTTPPTTTRPTTTPPTTTRPTTTRTTTKRPTTTPTTTSRPTTTTTRAPTTTTPLRNCLRDVEVVIEDPRHRSSDESRNVTDFLKAVVGKLSIGTHSTLMGVTTFTTSVTDHFGLKSHTSQGSLMSAIDGIRFTRGSDGIDYEDVTHFLDKHFIHGRENSREHVRKVVLIITDSLQTSSEHVPHRFHIDDDTRVIVLNINLSTMFNRLATSSSYILTTPLTTIIDEVDTVVSMICH